METKDKPDDESLVHFSEILMNYEQKNNNLVTFFCFIIK